MDVLLQLSAHHHPAVQLLVLHISGYHGAATRHPLRTSPSLLCFAPFVSLTLSVLLLCMLTFFYARKNWKSYTKHNLWAICVVDIIIATLYNWDIYLEPFDEYSEYMLIEIWIRPTITYGLVACFVTETENNHSK